MKAADIPDIRILSLIDAHRRDVSRPYAYQVLIAEGIPEKVVYAKYDRLYRRGFLEYGVSLRTSWLTPEGEAHLRSLRYVAA